MIKKIAYAGILMLAGLTLAFQDTSIASGGSHHQDDVCPSLVAGITWRNPFSSVEDVKAYVESHPNISGIALVHHETFPDPFPLTFLNDHPNVKKLILRGQVKDPATFNLAGLQHITSFSHAELLYGETLSFDYMPGLVELCICIHDLQNLGQMPELQTLTLKARYDPLHRIYGLQGIERFNLLTLNIHVTQIGDTTPCGLLSNLEHLKMDTCGWEEHQFAFIEQLKNLKSLKVNDGNEMNLAVLKDLPMLEDFEISCYESASKPGYLDPLATLPRLRRLSVASNGYLSDISALCQCTSLVDLDFCQSKVTSIEPLRALPLSRLIMSGSQVTDLWPLESVTTLEVLDITFGPPRLLEEWRGLSYHPALRRIKAGVCDFCLLPYISATDILIDAWFSTENIPKRVPDTNPFHVLGTIPNLELVCGWPFDKTQHMFDEFAKDRPDVLIVDHDDWETRVITKTGE